METARKLPNERDQFQDIMTVLSCIGSSVTRFRNPVLMPQQDLVCEVGDENKKSIQKFSTRIASEVKRIKLK
ncbi:MAG: hypothetical protein AB7O96_06700 [Pseudobdellovibrionaceae bacterium]